MNPSRLLDNFPACPGNLLSKRSLHNYLFTFFIDWNLPILNLFKWFTFECFLVNVFAQHQKYLGPFLLENKLKSISFFGHLFKLFAYMSLILEWDLL